MCLETRLISSFLCAIFILFCPFSALFAEEYRIGAGDVLSISVWQHSDLNRSVDVHSSGVISFPPMGEIQAMGQTPSGLAKKISERLHIFTRDWPQVTVTVTEFNSQKVFVMGEVVHPGIYTFEQIPNVWEVIKKAGGPSRAASVQAVKIVRGAGEHSRTHLVDLSKFIEGEGEFTLPPLQSGDSVIVPAEQKWMGDEKSTQELLLTGEVIMIMGAVARAGVYRTDGAIRLTEALVLAGGPTSVANLEKIILIKKSGEGGQHSEEINFKTFLRSGKESDNPVVHWGDRIFVQTRGRARREILRDVISVVQATTAVVNLYWILQALK